MDARNLLYTSAGAFLLLKEKAEEELNKTMEKGKVSKEEVKDFLEKARTKGSDEELQFKEEMKKIFKEIADELGLATKSDIEEIKELLSKSRE